jgi:hypothetical protein
MTKKGCIRLAADIRDEWDNASEYDKQVIRRMLGILCNNLKADNPRFDRERFIYAATGE